jgi:hypothetical protein
MIAKDDERMRRVALRMDRCRAEQIHRFATSRHVSSLILG